MELRSVICLLVFISSYATIFGNVWTQKRKIHKSKALTTNKMERLAAQSSIADFRSLLKPLLVVRVSGTPANKRVREYLHKTMEEFKWMVEDDVFTERTPYGMKEFANVIATHNPDAPHRLTLACHFDSKLFEKFKFVAATDSAVPCAMMLDLVRVLNPVLDKSKAKDVSLQLIFFDGEEAFVQWTKDDSLYGSRHLASKMHATHNMVEREVKVTDLDKMNSLVLLDLIGNRGTKFRNWFASTSKLFERLQKIEQRLKQRGQLAQPTGTYFIGELLRGGGIEDDHIPFLQKDVPVLHLIAYPFPETWHNASDDEAHIDYTTIDDLNKIFRVFVAEYLHLSP